MIVVYEDSKEDSPLCPCNIFENFICELLLGRLSEAIDCRLRRSHVFSTADLTYIRTNTCSSSPCGPDSGGTSRLPGTNHPTVSSMNMHRVHDGECLTSQNHGSRPGNARIRVTHDHRRPAELRSRKSRIETPLRTLASSRGKSFAAILRAQD